jgi:hypothetical protein
MEGLSTPSPPPFESVGVRVVSVDSDGSDGVFWTFDTDLVAVVIDGSAIPQLTVLGITGGQIAAWPSARVVQVSYGGDPFDAGAPWAVSGNPALLTFTGGRPLVFPENGVTNI